MRRSTAVRAAAVTVLAAGVAAPLVRRRLALRAPVVLGAAAAAPVALCVLFPRSRARDVGTCALQMYAYVTAYKMPNDDPEKLERRVKVAYPVRADRLIGGGTTPTLRLQRALGTPGSFKAWEKVLVVSHWVWFAFPHGTVLYLLFRRPERFPDGAARIYATFDIGLLGYWLVPTAPPWYAAAQGLMEDGRTPELRRMMVEYGEHFWRSGWAPLYGVLGGNPLAAMPSLHFATSVTAAHVLAETGVVHGTIGWTYTLMLGLALVYLGEHYVVDLAAGLALAEGVRKGVPAAKPLGRRLSSVVQALEVRAPVMRDAPVDESSSAPVREANSAAAEDDEAREAAPPRLQFTARNLLVLGGFLAASIAAMYYLLPQLAGLEDTWHRIEDGSPYWMFLALVFTAGMFGGYVMMFRGVFIRVESARRIGWRESYQITMAGLAASRIFAAGGAGGLVLTAWALRRAGMRKRLVADTTLSFLILTYIPYVAALIVCGLGLRLGIFSGEAPFGLTVVPAALAAIALAVGLSIALIPTDLQRRLGGLVSRGDRWARIAQKLANVPASASAGMRDALAHARSGDPALLGAFLFWGFQILVLWAAFRAFGNSPPPAVLVQAFFVGMLGNLLPMPGGVGGVEGGMIASFVAFGVDGGLAVVAVLVYRAFTFWLPLIPGVIAYFQLRKTVERWSLHYTK